MSTRTAGPRRVTPELIEAERVARRRRGLLRGLRLSGTQLFCFVVAAGFFALPLVYLLLQAFKTYPGFLKDPTGLPHPWTLSNFSAAWNQGGFGVEMINSLIYAVVPDVITLILGVFLAFPISRGWFKHSNVLYSFFVFSGFLPAGLIPLFVEAQKLGLYDNQVGYLILTSLTGAGFFFFVGYIKTIPRELDEAAAMDGCGYVRFIFQIIIPQMKPALATFAIFGFVASWNNLILPLIMLNDSSLWPVTRGLYGFFGEHTTQWPLIAAATVIVALPILVVFALLQRHLVEGVAGGAATGSAGVGNAPAAVAAEE
ncbi:carbohydrate ABC transporter permease [Streptacidiphilus sp. P02-A3a]|uniref:carbohydrate ABC transporter permease n=1 Tax=Streptacidiphilus sp. P02-A3a TaxID=2704468 RepID=UPI001CDC7148|nr:carbohydrate ABC transporter permease [Streptacidiphilus sp. P02-A3a]